MIRFAKILNFSYRFFSLSPSPSFHFPVNGRSGNGHNLGGPLFCGDGTTTTLSPGTLASIKVVLTLSTNCEEADWRTTMKREWEWERARAKIQASHGRNERSFDSKNRFNWSLRRQIILINYTFVYYILHNVLDLDSGGAMTVTSNASANFYPLAIFTCKHLPMLLLLLQRCCRRNSHWQLIYWNYQN